MSTRFTIYIFVLVASILHCGWVSGQDSTIIVAEGFHRNLKRPQQSEEAKISELLWNTQFAMSKTDDVSCAGILQALNTQLAKLERPLQIRFEISKGSQEYFRLLLSKPLTTWQAKSVGESEVRAQLKKANLLQVISAVSDQLRVNSVWYSDTILLSNYISGN